MMKREHAEPTGSDGVRLRASDMREGEMRLATLPTGRKALLFKHGERFTAFSEVCPHMGADLSEGVVCERKRTLQCPWHGYIFSTETGQMLENPNEEMTKLLRVRTKSFDPEKQVAFKLRSLTCTRDGEDVVFESGIKGP